MVNLSYGNIEILASATENLTDPNVSVFQEGFFGIYSQVTKQTKWLKVVNNLNYFPRCDSFNIEVVDVAGNENLSSGIVYLKENGFYEYSIYTNVDGVDAPTSNDTLLERGKCLLEFSDATITTYNPNIEVIVYDRE